MFVLESLINFVAFFFINRKAIVHTKQEVVLKNEDIDEIVREKSMAEMFLEGN